MSLPTSSRRLRVIGAHVFLHACDEFIVGLPAHHLAALAVDHSYHQGLLSSGESCLSDLGETGVRSPRSSSMAAYSSLTHFKNRSFGNPSPGSQWSPHLNTLLTWAWVVSPRAAPFASCRSDNQRVLIEYSQHPLATRNAARRSICSRSSHPAVDHFAYPQISTC